MKNEIPIYELLGLIKDGKAPKKIEYKGDTYIYAGDDYSINDNREDWLITKYDYFLTNFLNEKVKILEEDKPIIEKISISGKDIHKLEELGIYDIVENIDCKLNEIIRYLNKKENK